MREFRHRWQAVAAIEAQERKRASITLRWQQTNAILRLAIGLGLSLSERTEEEQPVRDRWIELKERWDG